MDIENASDRAPTRRPASAGRRLLTRPRPPRHGGVTPATPPPAPTASGGCGRPPPLSRPRSLSAGPTRSASSSHRLLLGQRLGELGTDRFPFKRLGPSANQKSIFFFRILKRNFSPFKVCYNVLTNEVHRNTQQEVRIYYFLCPLGRFSCVLF